MSDNIRKSIQDRAQRDIVEQSFFRWESAVVIALTMVLTAGFSLISLPIAFASFVAGVMAEALLVYTSINDPETSQRVIDQILHEEFHPERLSNPDLQQKISRAFNYRSRIETALRKRSNNLIQETLNETAEQIDDWLKNIYSLAQRVDGYEEEKTFLERDKARISQRILELKKKIKSERDSKVKQQIEVTIEGLCRQQDTIEGWENTMKRAGLQLEHTISALGTIYSQTLLTDAKNINSGQVARELRSNITEEVHQLDDLLAAMDDVYADEAYADEAY